MPPVSRRGFLKTGVVIAGAGSAAVSPAAAASRADCPTAGSASGTSTAGETLYNGIRLPETWPPTDMVVDNYDPMPVPYLVLPPKVIPIDVGRQLFVDDFLIEKTDAQRKFHQPEKYSGNPLITPQRDW